MERPEKMFCFHSAPAAILKSLALRVGGELREIYCLNLLCGPARQLTGPSCDCAVSP
jgi:hypothetical protein